MSVGETGNQGIFSVPLDVTKPLCPTPSPPLPRPIPCRLLSPQGYDLFCVNGLTFPDRSPHPALWEAKFLAQPVGVDLVRKPANSAVVKLLLTNRYDFLSLDHLSASWRLLSAAASSPDTPLFEGSLPTAGMSPGGSREVEIERFTLRSVDAGGRGELFLHVEARLNTDTPWAPEGHLVAWGCFPVGEAMPPGDGEAGDEASSLGSLAQGGVPRWGIAGGPRVAGEVAGEGAVRFPRSPLIVYEDEEGSVSSREESPMGQL